jgi:hypothetical protein
VGGRAAAAGAAATGPGGGGAGRSPPALPPAAQLDLEVARTQAHLAEGRRGLEQVDQLQHVLVVHRLAVHLGSLALKVCGRTGRQEAGPAAGSAKNFDERNS